MIARRLGLLCVATTLIALNAAAGASATERFPGLWLRSIWTTIGAPQTPAEYIRLYEPRSEVIGDLGRPRKEFFVCPKRRCNHLLAAQIDQWRAHKTAWTAIFAARRSVAVPRIAVSVEAKGGRWKYRWLHGGEHAGQLWLQPAIPCKRPELPPGAKTSPEGISLICERPVFERFDHRHYLDVAAVEALGHRVEVAGVLDLEGFLDVFVELLQQLVATQPHHAPATNQEGGTLQLAAPSGSGHGRNGLDALGPVARLAAEAATAGAAAR